MLLLVRNLLKVVGEPIVVHPIRRCRWRLHTNSAKVLGGIKGIRRT